MDHPFGNLLTQYRARTHGLSQAKLAAAIGYDPALIGKMAKGGKELTGPSGRSRVVRIIAALHSFGVLAALDEANALLGAAGMPPLFDGHSTEARLIAQLEPPVSPQPPSPASWHISTSNLPAFITSFVGREVEITELVEQVKTLRLITLTGSGGVGKTRLAIEVGRRVESAFPHGVCLVEFASLTDSTLLPRTVASALKLAEQVAEPTTDVLIASLKSKQLLLILDNCEHLIDASAVLIETLLHHCPNLHVLVTSRETLRVVGEVAHRVPSLSLPTSPTSEVGELLTFESVQLFHARAVASQSTFEWSAGNAAAVQRICTQLDGIPLAIELAASRLRMFSVEEVANRITDRFGFLVSGSRTALPRHRTLRATIAWSYDLLPENEQALLARLSVFAGEFTAAAAEYVSDQTETLTSLSNLVDKSLLIAEAKGASTRYRLLETIRQFAAEMLADDKAGEAARARHLEFFVQQSREAARHANTPHQRAWLDRLDADHDNLRSALRHAARISAVASTFDILEATWELWLQRGYLREGLRWVEGTLSGNELAPDLRARALIWLGWLCSRLGRRTDAVGAFREALSMATALREERLVFHALVGLGWNTPSSEESSATMAAAVRLAGQVMVDWHLADALVGQGVMARIHGDGVLAAASLSRGLRMSREVNHRLATSVALHHLGIIAIEDEQHAEARAMLEECVHIAREMGSRVDIAEGLVELARADLGLGDRMQAALAANEALAAFAWMGISERVAQCLVVLARIAWDRGQVERATRILAATAATQLTLRKDYNTHITFDDEYRRLLHTLRSELAPRAFLAIWAEGRAMTLDQAIAYAHLMLAE